jgi:deazaflavin-dependent oxidoreductase (nitroreductase family)
MIRAPAVPHRGLHAFARRWLNPWVLHLRLAGGRRSPLGLVHHVGRRSGRAYATPLAVHRRGGRLFVPLTYGPNARWCLNVRAAGSCLVSLRGQRLSAARPRVIERASLPPGLRRAYRVIPIREFLDLTIIGPEPARGGTG